MVCAWRLPRPEVLFQTFFAAARRSAGRPPSTAWHGRRPAPGTPASPALQAI